MRENTTATAILELASKGYTTTKDKPQLPARRMDSWVNPSTGFGDNHSANSTSHYLSNIILPTELESLYRDDWVARKGCDMPADDMTRKGISFLHNEDDEENIDTVDALDDALTNDFELMPRAKEAIAFSRLSGGSATFFNYGGTENDQADPIEDSQKNEIKWIKVFPSWDAIPVSWYTDFEHPKYNEPEHYQVVIKGAGLGKVVHVHESRLIIMQGRLNTPISRANKRGWFDSILQNAYASIRDFQIAGSSASGVMEDFIYKTLGIKNLAEMTMNREDDLILERIYLASQKMHVGGVAVYDAEGETLQKHGTPAAGLSELWDRHGDIICGALDIPRSQMFSAEAGSLGGTSAETDRSNYFDKIISQQENKLRPWINQYISNTSIVLGIDDTDIKFDFNPLREQTSTEATAERYTQAQTDAIYLDRQVVSPEEVAVNRYSKSKPDLVTMNLDFEEREKLKEEADQQDQDEMQGLIDDMTNKETPIEKDKVNEPEKKMDSAPVVNVTPEITVESPNIEVNVPEQKDNSDQIVTALEKGFGELKDKLNEDIEIEGEE